MKFYKVFEIFKDTSIRQIVEQDKRYVIDPSCQRHNARPFTIIKQGDTAVFKPNWKLPAKLQLPNIINPIFEITKDIKKTRRMNKCYKDIFINEMFTMMLKPDYKLPPSSKRRFLQFIDQNVIWDDREDDWMELLKKQLKNDYHDVNVVKQIYQLYQHPENEFKVTTIADLHQRALPKPRVGKKRTFGRRVVRSESESDSSMSEESEWPVTIDNLRGTIIKSLTLSDEQIVRQILERWPFIPDVRPSQIYYKFLIITQPHIDIKELTAFQYSNWQFISNQDDVWNYFTTLTNLYNQYKLDEVVAENLKAIEDIENEKKQNQVNNSVQIRSPLIRSLKTKYKRILF